jgi:hypothetical protein
MFMLKLGVSPRVLRPQMRKTCKDIEERIACVTDSKRTPIDLYNGTKGTKATRETRMEVVAWIAVCKFDCRLEGGFVRDWIVGRDIQRPGNSKTNPKGWIETTTPVPALNKEVVPCDLDCHLPSHAYFDISKFQDELYKYGVTCSVYRENWRYVLLFDEHEATGPFTMDLIEPHVALTHDRIDFDVNNLSLEKDYTHELGMRIDVTQKPYSIELETIIDNIKNKLFRILRPVDAYLTERIDKMNKRGWKETGERLSVIPSTHWKQNVILVPLLRSAVLYTEVSKKMDNIPGVNIVSIEEIRNPFLEETYEGMKKLIKKQCTGANPNEQELFHGTNGEAIDGITEDGFDDRYFNANGMYGKYRESFFMLKMIFVCHLGHGAYFADNPLKSHDYTAANPDNNNTRVMFYNKVLLGNPSILTAANNSLVSAPIGFHSVIGKHSPRTEYIIYRYGQALPYLKIIYRA